LSVPALTDRAVAQQARLLLRGIVKILLGLA